MSRTPFKLRSGNTTAFKDMGSSPAKLKLKIPSPGKILKRATKFIRDKAMPWIHNRAMFGLPNLLKKGKYAGKAAKSAQKDVIKAGELPKLPVAGKLPKPPTLGQYDKA